MANADHNTLDPDSGKENASLRRAGFFAVLCGCAIALLAVGNAQGWFRFLGLSEDMTDFIFGVVTGVLVGTAVLVFWKTRRRSGDTRTAAARIDEFQSRQHRILLAITIVTSAVGGMAIFHPLHHGGAIDIAYSIEFALIAVAMAAAITFGVGFVQRRYRIAANDELARLLRGRAVQLGYLLAIGGVCASYLLCLYRADLAAVALPLALLVGVVVPAVYLLIAESRASGDD
ncbi:MAG TPA: hypothetical protein VGB91_02970 [Rhizomicrobium sp.]